MNYKKYSDYKPSGIEWVTTIPTHWQVRPLFSVMREREEKNTDNQVTNVLSLSYGRIIPRDVESNFGLLPESFTTYQIVNPSNIILRLTDLQNDKRSLRVGLSRERGIITSAYFCLETSTQLDAEYAYYLLHSYDISKVFYGLGGGVRQSMKFEDMKHLPIVCPSLDEQRAVVTFLNRETAKLDALVEKKQRLIELLQEYRQALITQAVTKGLDPNVPMKDSGIEWLGEVPAHWDIVAFKRFFDVRDGTHDTPEYVDPTEDTFPLVTSKDVKDGDIDFSDTKHISREDHSKIKARSLVERNDILMPMIGTIGNPVIVSTDREFSIKNVALFKTGNDNLLAKFGCYFLSSRTCQVQFDLQNRGGVQSFVSLDILRNLKITLPRHKDARTELSQIVDFLDRETSSINVLIRKIWWQIEKIQEYRQALISAAVTGQIDVRRYTGNEVEVATP